MDKRVSCTNHTCVSHQYYVHYIFQVEHQGVLDKAREEYESRLQQAVERIVLLQKEVEKYKTLAGIEKFAQNALSGIAANDLSDAILLHLLQNILKFLAIIFIIMSTTVTQV